ncbi:hypothetical protein [Roseateles albus]|uniref:Uncharacterized protein n=1 Tax=Roseateles albus TaxID=2987525 RepID=A0ABT5KCR2_9BURK|nr:hypothetical protein [Roseateles albus]MDC8771717.1 hypothetical protein [Roseateles albus]
MKRLGLSALLLLACAFAFGATDEDGYNEYTIRPVDIPSDAPMFEKFPAEVFAGSNAAPILHGDPKTRMFRSRLARWAKERPNFAGHYILATWGCGTECTQISIIDALTGRIYHPPGVSTNVAVNVHESLLEGGGDLWHAAGAIKFKPDSRLLILIGMPEERVENRGVSYYVLENNKLRRIRFVPKAWYPSS